MKLENRVAHCLQLYIKSEFTCLKRRRKWPILYNFHYGTRATGSNFQEYAFWDMAYSKNAIAKLVNFKILIAIYKKIAGFINKNFLELDSACLNL
jgi:hypothetical protein